MIDAIKKIVRDTPLYDLFVHYHQKKELSHWIKNGKIGPVPHLIKQATVKEYSRRFNIRILIETGTYMGDMLKAMCNEFERIVSIELSHELAERAKKKFSRRPHITIHKGDSSNILPTVLSSISQPALFWLDGHFSGGYTAKADYETPIKNELNCIFNHYIDNHIILIDDARCFIGKDDYPTLKELKEVILEIRPNFHIEVKEDIIRIYKSISDK